MDSVRMIVAFLKAGYKVGIFPEGTTRRPEGRQFGQFDDSFLAFAGNTNSLVQPITLLWVKEKGRKRVIVNFAEAFEVNGKNKEELMREFRATQERSLQENIQEAQRQGLEIIRD